MLSTLLCEICRQPIRGVAYEVDYTRGVLGDAEGAPASSRRVHFCDPCGAKFRRVLAHERVVATALKPPERA